LAGWIGWRKDHQVPGPPIVILQNGQRVRVRFLTVSGTLPLGAALLFAARLGALLVLVSGAARRGYCNCGSCHRAIAAPTSCPDLDSSPQIAAEPPAWGPD
jgi:hypothetical protein